MDHEIWEHAREHDLVILTKDSDFDELSQLYGCPPKVVHLICGNRTTDYISNLILSHKSALIEFANSDSKNCLLKLAS